MGQTTQPKLKLRFELEALSMSSKTRVDSTDKHGVESATKSLAKPKLFRRFFQFRLLALLLLVIPVAFAAIHVRNLLDDRPVDWKPFSKSELDQHIRDQEAVLVFLTDDSKNLKRKSLDLSGSGRSYGTVR